MRNHDAFVLRPHLPRDRTNRGGQREVAPRRRAGACCSAWRGDRGLEPACLLSLRDEFLGMGLGEPAERWPAARSRRGIPRARASRGRLNLPLVALPETRRS